MLPSTAEAPVAAPVRPPAAPTDAELVARVLAGERAQFELLMRRHDRRVYRAVRAVLRDEAEAEDAMQAAWLAALGHLADLEGTAAFATWVTRIAVNEALARLRRRSRIALAAERGEPVDPPAPAGPSDPERRAAARELVALLERAVDRLPLAYRTVFVLRDVEGLSTADAAACLGIGEELARVRLFRARRALRAEIDAMLGKDAPGAFAFDAVRCDRIVRAVMAAAGAGDRPAPPGA